jgi:hypothetical protein
MMLGLQISEVPNFCEAPGFDEDPGVAFMKAAHEWLALRGWGHITMDAPGMLFQRHYSKGFVLAAGMTSRGFLHSVVYKDGELWHDPHPSHEGIEAVLEVDLLFPLNPLSMPVTPVLPPMDEQTAEAAFKEGFDLGARFHATFHGWDNAAAERAWQQHRNLITPSNGGTAR